MADSAIVSNTNESLILVDELDREIGSCSKSECHEGSGKLHRAFSIFISNKHGEMLLQRRSGKKPLWPGYWSNACCSHPRRGEEMADAIYRRINQELGFECPLTYLYKFKYQAQYNEVGSENEYCWVYHGIYDGEVKVNRNEIADWRFVDLKEFEADLKTSPEIYTPWLKMEWLEIRKNYLEKFVIQD